MKKAVQKSHRRRLPGVQRGYVLLTLMLSIALLTIAAATVASSVAFQIRREREQELVHRGVQYARAVRLFNKHTGRFPSRFDELRDTAGVRYLRRVYKDPMTHGDFQPVYTSDIAKGEVEVRSNACPGEKGLGRRTTSPNLMVMSGNHPRGEIFYGVVSKCGARTIREFNHKSYYNQWLFFYDPYHDRGLEIHGPTAAIPPGAAVGQLGAPVNQQPTPSISQQPGTPAGEQASPEAAQTSPQIQ